MFEVRRNRTNLSRLNSFYRLGFWPEALNEIGLFMFVWDSNPLFFYSKKTYFLFFFLRTNQAKHAHKTCPQTKKTARRKMSRNFSWWLIDFFSFVSTERICPPQHEVSPNQSHLWSELWQRIRHAGAGMFSHQTPASTDNTTKRYGSTQHNTKNILHTLLVPKRRI